MKREVLEETGYRVVITGFPEIYKEINQDDGTKVIIFITTRRSEDKKTDNLEDDIHQREWIA